MLNFLKNVFKTKKQIMEERKEWICKIADRYGFKCSEISNYEYIFWKPENDNFMVVHNMMEIFRVTYKLSSKRNDINNPQRSDFGRIFKKLSQ